MKKFIIGLVIFITGTFLFAGEISNYVSITYNYGIFTERAENAKTKLSSSGIDLSFITYYNDNWGFYLNTDYLFPTEATVTSGGISVTATDADWDFSMLLSVILGPSYKYTINEKFDLFGAIGFHLAEYSMNSKKSAALNFSFGIGGDLGFRFTPTEHFYITGGCLLSHDFYCVGKVSTKYGSKKVSDSYNFGSVRPYIGIGFKYKTNWN